MTTTRTSAHRPRAGVVLAALTTIAAVAGCGGPGGGGGASSPHRQPSKSTSEQPTSGEASAAVSAADGRDVGACADGDCEIAVSEPVSFRFKGPAGPATLSVTEVGVNKIEYTVKSGNGRIGGGATGRGQGCLTVVRSTGGGSSCGGLGPAARPSPQPHAVVIQAATGADGTATLDIVSG
ncbi:hypothetical protein AB0I22_04630 [Streptomyces sp. NPDC050610]|uniref:hypothetical protein n=1 Tax=Streptomyces sp. NPDC050610 TaxID=3157097 RepID=UPI00342A473E